MEQPVGRGYALTSMLREPMNPYASFPPSGALLVARYSAALFAYIDEQSNVSVSRGRAAEPAAGLPVAEPERRIDLIYK